MKHLLSRTCILLCSAFLASAVSAQEQEEDIEAAWKKFAGSRAPLPPEKNSFVALERLFRTVPKDVQKEFFDRGRVYPQGPFHEWIPSANALKQCRKFQKRGRKIIAHGPGQMPPLTETINTEIGPYSLYSRFNQALAAHAYHQGHYAQAADNLLSNFEFAEYLTKSSYDVAGAMWPNVDRRQIFEQILEVNRAAPNRKLLDRLDAGLRKTRFDNKTIGILFRKQAQESYRTLQRYPAFIRETEFELRHFDPEFSLRKHSYEEPLRSLDLKSVLNLKYDKEASLRRELAVLKKLQTWAISSRPLKLFPSLLEQSVPKKLKYYEGSRNGLYEIHVDCAKTNVAVNIVLSLKNTDLMLLTSTAWLKAEADGHTVTSLSDLVPKYLKTVPKDPADGKPLRLLRKERVIYSIGTDLKDNKGLVADSEDYSLHPTEPAFQIPKLR